MINIKTTKEHANTEMYSVISMDLCLEQQYRAKSIQIEVETEGVDHLDGS